VRRCSGLAFQGRNRSSAGPVSGLPPLRAHSSRQAVKIGRGVEADHLGGAGNGPDHGGVPRSVAVMGTAGVLPGHDRASDHRLEAAMSSSWAA
jgi:hypothetical protein